MPQLPDCALLLLGQSPLQSLLGNTQRVHVGHEHARKLGSQLKVGGAVEEEVGGTGGEAQKCQKKLK